MLHTKHARWFVLSIVSACLAGTTVFSGCATSRPTAGVAKPQNNPILEEVAPPPGTVRSMQLADVIAEQIVKADAEIEKDNPEATARATKEAKKGHAPIPLEFNQRVQKWIHYFTQRDRERFQRFLDRGAEYERLIQSVLTENGMPVDLYYLAMIESGFTTHATSRASAVGIWQFMSGTGKLYGLRVDRFVDERRSPIEATHAAAAYLADLHNIFQSWYLAIAAYNSGEFRVVRAIRQGKSRNFWELAEKGVLPRETMDYIPKFIAAVLIGKNPEHYGFRRPEPQEIFPAAEAVSIPAGVRLSTVALASGVDLPVLQKLNPHLLHGMTPPGRESFDVWVPKELASKVELAQSSLERSRVTYAQASPDRDEAPSRLPSNRIIRREEREAAKARTLGVNVKVSRVTEKTYRVRRGDTLTLIAQRFGMSVRKIKKINGIKRNRIFVGQALKVSPQAPSGA